MIKKFLSLVFLWPALAEATCLSDETLDRVEFARTVLLETKSDLTRALAEIREYNDFNVPVISALVEEQIAFVDSYNIIADGISSCAPNSTELMLAVEEERKRIQDNVVSTANLGYIARGDIVFLITVPYTAYSM